MPIVVQGQKLYTLQEAIKQKIALFGHRIGEAAKRSYLAEQAHNNGKKKSIQEEIEDALKY